MHSSLEGMGQTMDKLEGYSVDNKELCLYILKFYVDLNNLKEHGIKR